MNLVKKAGEFIQENGSTLLTITGVLGMFGAVGLGIRGTVKAVDILNKRRAEEKRKNDKFIDFTKRGVIRETWKCYLPCVAVALASAGCAFGANAISLRRTAAITGVYTLTEHAFREYREKVRETVGTNKEQKLRDEIAEDRVRDNPPREADIIITPNANVLFCDNWCGRYFKSDIEHIRKSVNTINNEILTSIGGFATLNEFYFLIGLPRVQDGDLLGWSVEHGVLEIDYTHTKINEETGEPCIILTYIVKPRYTRG